MYIERERERACLQGAPGAGDGREDNAAVALEAVRGKSEGVAVLGHRRQHHLLRGQEGRHARARTQQHVKAKKRVLASTGESRVGVVRLMRAASLLVLLQVLVA